jgi:hypothetical protein
MKKGSKLKVESISFLQTVDGFRLNVEARGLSPHTISDYWNTYRKFAEYLKDDLLLTNITIQRIEGFLAAQHVSNKTKLNYHINLGG